MQLVMLLVLIIALIVLYLVRSLSRAEAAVSEAVCDLKMLFAARSEILLVVLPGYPTSTFSSSSSASKSSITEFTKSLANENLHLSSLAPDGVRALEANERSKELQLLEDRIESIARFLIWALKGQAISTLGGAHTIWRKWSLHKYEGLVEQLLSVKLITHRRITYLSEADLPYIKRGKMI